MRFAKMAKILHTTIAIKFVELEVLYAYLYVNIDWY